MKNKIIYFIAIIIILFITIISIGHLIKNNYVINPETRFTLNTKPIVASDGNIYKVHNYNDATSAANILATINKKIIELMAYLKYKYIGTGYTNAQNDQNDITSAVNKILMRYNPDNLVENSPNDKVDTSYTINKGSMIAVCLREKGNNNYIHDIDTLIFVTIHELAHIAIDDDGHPPKFWKMFKILLIEAEMGNIYYSKNYNLYPVHYCGMDINYNPRFDDKL